MILDGKKMNIGVLEACVDYRNSADRAKKFFLMTEYISILPHQLRTLLVLGGETDIENMGIMKEAIIMGSGPAWTQDEINILLDGVKDGHTFLTIAEKLGRNESGCIIKYRKLKKLGMTDFVKSVGTNVESVKSNTGKRPMVSKPEPERCSSERDGIFTAEQRDISEVCAVAVAPKKRQYPDDHTNQSDNRGNKCSTVVEERSEDKLPVLWEQELISVCRQINAEYEMFREAAYNEIDCMRDTLLELYARQRQTEALLDDTQAEISHRDAVRGDVYAKLAENQAYTDKLERELSALRADAETNNINNAEVAAYTNKLACEKRILSMRIDTMQQEADNIQAQYDMFSDAAYNDIDCLTQSNKLLTSLNEQLTAAVKCGDDLFIKCSQEIDRLQQELAAAKHDNIRDKRVAAKSELLAAIVRALPYCCVRVNREIIIVTSQNDVRALFDEVASNATLRGVGIRLDSGGVVFSTSDTDSVPA